MNTGLTKKDRDYITNMVQKFPEIEKAILFGSRAIGNHKDGSDVDLTILGENITNQTVLRLRYLLNEELPLPYFFDVVHYETIINEKLKQHIEKYGVGLALKS